MKEARGARAEQIVNCTPSPPPGESVAEGEVLRRLHAVAQAGGEALAKLGIVNVNLRHNTSGRCDSYQAEEFQS